MLERKGVSGRCGLGGQVEWELHGQGTLEAFEQEAPVLELLTVASSWCLHPSYFYGLTFATHCRHSLVGCSGPCLSCGAAPLTLSHLPSSHQLARWPA